MVAKILLLFALAIVGSQAVTTVQLSDQTISHISSPWHPMSIGIGILFLDKLVSCHVIMPSGLIFELYPNAQTLTHTSMINNAKGDTMFPSCGMFFSNPPESLSGTYEILCLVEHAEDSSQTFSRQKYHITFIPSEVEWPMRKLVHVQEEVKEEIKKVERQ